VASNRFADFPTMGLDANGLYIGTNNFSSGGSFQDVSLYSIPKADLLLASPTVANRTSFTGLNASNYGFTLQAAVNFASTASNTPIVATDADVYSVLNRSTL